MKCINAFQMGGVAADGHHGQSGPVQVYMYITAVNRNTGQRLLKGQVMGSIGLFFLHQLQRLRRTNPEVLPIPCEP